MKKLAIAITAVAAFTGSAVAADMPVKARYIAPVATAYNWTGCYVGAGWGYGMWNQDNQSFNPSGVAGDQQHTDGGRGFFGTGQVGCDYQFAPKWVVGAFGDFDVGSLKGTMTVPGFGMQGDEKERWSWAVGARAGYLPWDSLLVFMSGGFTQARFDAVDFVNTSGVSVNRNIAEQTYNGFFLGSGYEYKLDWMPGLTWKTEYRFADYGSQDNPIITTSTGLATGSYGESHKYIQTIRSELVYRFNMGR
jgi:outer membrane immunogenic protein